MPEELFSLQSLNITHIVIAFIAINTSSVQRDQTNITNTEIIIQK